MNKKIMKRSLALGALMAFVITGSAFAAAEARYVEGEGKALVIDSQESGKDRIVGGYASKSIDDVDKLTQKFDSDVTVNTGNWNMVMGGCYPGDLSNTNLTMNISSTKVVINDGVSVRHLVGGTGASNVHSVTSSGVRTANLVINGGSFGNISDWTGVNTLESLVVGGDHIKNYPVGDNLDNSSDVKLTSTKTEIFGGTFNSLVIGGSLANQYYAHVDSGILKAHVDTAETIITGGTFNKPIIAGGVAMGTNAISDVGTAILSISNATINSDVFTAGMVRYADAKGSEGASVGNSVVTIKDTTITGSIHNTRGFAKYDNNEWHFYAEDECFAEAGTGVDDFAKSTTTELTLVNASVGRVDITEGSVALRAEDREGVEGKTSINTFEVGEVVATASVNGAINDAVGGDYKEAAKRITFGQDDAENILKEDGSLNYVSSFTLDEGAVAGKTVVYANGHVTTYANEGNTGISEMTTWGLISWRAEMNDMNKRMGELRNANGEHGVWVRMVRGEDEYKSIKNQYNQYQLGYDEKLSVDKRWTVGAALSYTDAENSFAKGSGESENKAISFYGSKLNDDGTFVDLIAKYGRLENDFKLASGIGNAEYSTNAYSVSAEIGKRIQQKGYWVEPQAELTYGKVSSVNYTGESGATVVQDGIESLVGRVGFSIGKDIEKGNVYARASYLYDFDGETEATFSRGKATEVFKQDLGGGWWEVGVGANINLSKATYIYADVEKTFGGEVDTNWQWNLGVRYSF